MKNSGRGVHFEKTIARQGGSERPHAASMVSIGSSRLASAVQRAFVALWNRLGMGNGCKQQIARGRAGSESAA